MGKRIIQQARGKGSSTYRVRKKGFKYRIQIPKKLEGKGKIIKLVNSSAHSSPLAKINYSGGFFYIPACEKMFEGQIIDFGENKNERGNIVKIGGLPPKTEICCIESKPGDGGKFIKTGGNSAITNRIKDKSVIINMPSKKQKKLNKNCRAIIGRIAGHGRLEKPFIKAGKKHHLKKSKSKLWPRTGALKMNAVDHPFGSGRGKNPKSKIAKRNASPGSKVGLLRPKRTGKRK